MYVFVSRFFYSPHLRADDLAVSFHQHHINETSSLCTLYQHQISFEVKSMNKKRISPVLGTLIYYMESVSMKQATVNRWAAQ